MGSSKQTETPGDAALEPAGPAEVEWTVHLARRQPMRAAAVTAAVCLAGATGTFALGPALGVASALLIGLSCGEFLFPVRFRVHAGGASAKGLTLWREIRWTEVKRIAVGEEEVKLSPSSSASKTDAFRGVVLRCPYNREEVLKAVRAHRNAASGN